MTGEANTNTADSETATIVVDKLTTTLPPSKPTFNTIPAQQQHPTKQRNITESPKYDKWNSPKNNRRHPPTNCHCPYQKTNVRATVNFLVAPIVFQLLAIVSLFFAGFDLVLQNYYAGSYQMMGVSDGGGPKVLPGYSFLDNGYGLLLILGLHH